MYNYLKSIEALSNSANIHKGEITDFAKEVLITATKTLDCNRGSVWLFEQDQTKLVSLISYACSDNMFSNQMTLDIAQLPNYFKFLKKNVIIVSNDTMNNPMTSELLDSYIIPNKITSMVDVPLRSEGKMIGVICFEYIEIQHSWTDDEQLFIQSLAQLLSLALETKKKKEYQIALEKIIIQKEVLISEVNHRVKNNMAVIISLINLQKQKTKDIYHSWLFEEINNKVYSMSMIQEQLNANGNVESINLGTFLKNLVNNLNTSYGEDKNIEINLELEKVEVDISKAIPCGLIANEILTNSFKYAFDLRNEFPKLTITLKQKDDNVELIFYDNGPGFDLKTPQAGMGLELIKDLSEQIDAEITVNFEKGVVIKIVLPSF
ncbi:GAF domain-containing protein [Brumimicrobium glaciale]|uniref:histidine kinase n=1 Tax=Brumimicrobium glaciale TaxID=200475 RepID=A0A4Q4KK95_9FLAO|nr:histidine kinase dimerization/phosphoacceptor domain -containing protein [Brumimicrobium glaciale]RYM33773.1 GAF domain-containing protein [Brumimicrobium glaciale]